MDGLLTPYGVWVRPLVDASSSDLVLRGELGRLELQDLNLEGRRVIFEVREPLGVQLELLTGQPRQPRRELHADVAVRGVLHDLADLTRVVYRRNDVSRTERVSELPLQKHPRFMLALVLDWERAFNPIQSPPMVVIHLRDLPDHTLWDVFVRAGPGDPVANLPSSFDADTYWPPLLLPIGDVLLADAKVHEALSAFVRRERVGQQVRNRNHQSCAGRRRRATGHGNDEGIDDAANNLDIRNGVQEELADAVLRIRHPHLAHAMFLLTTRTALALLGFEPP
mmetsp:Transcript_58682/g.184033  ORF Transcript_58682/g.184033 Transcript_58682/m.184033 type:complete len:281 (+) Transcript_58682:1015-1857(+)